MLWHHLIRAFPDYNWNILSISHGIAIIFFSQRIDMPDHYFYFSLQSYLLKTTMMGYDNSVISFFSWIFMLRNNSYYCGNFLRSSFEIWRGFCVVIILRDGQRNFFLITPGHVVIFSSAALSSGIVIFQVNDEDESSDDGMLCKIYSVIPCFYIKSVYHIRNLGSIPCSLVMAGIPCCIILACMQCSIVRKPIWKCLEHRSISSPSSSLL